MKARVKSPVKAPAEFKIVRLRECPVECPIVENPPQIESFWRKQVVKASWFNEDKECLCVFLLNTRNRLTGFELVSQGNLDTVLIHPRDVFRLASIRNAAGIVIAHNHPSGDPTPSDADIKITRDLIRAAAMMKIELIDHVIIGDKRLKKSYRSLRGLGYFSVAEPSEKKTQKKARCIMDAAEEMNQAASQSNVLLELIECHLDQREHRLGENFTGERADKFNFGFGMLAQHARERLKQAAGNIMDAAHGKRQAVAS